MSSSGIHLRFLSLALPLTVAALAAQTGPALAALVHTGDSTIQGGLCVGLDCDASEPMGFATIKLEENNLRITAADSSVGSFPTRDWQIEFNSNFSGGVSYFMIRDCGNAGGAAAVDASCGGTPMLTIEAGASANSIYVDSSGSGGGNVGFGTANPVLDLHVVSGNSPALRLEQDNSSGFTPQTWDLVGNEANFFIRDVTNGSRLPFRIRPNSATNTLFVDNGRIGINTNAPAAPLEIRDPGTFVFFRLTATGATIPSADLTYTNAGGGELRYNIVDADGPEMRLDAAGNLVITGALTQNSDRAAKTAIDPVDPAVILAKVAALEVAEWSYRDDTGVRHIGPMAQDFHALFGTGASETGISTLDTSGVALAAIQALAAQNAAQRARLAALADENRTLAARLDRLEARAD